MNAVEYWLTALARIERRRKAVKGFDPDWEKLAHLARLEDYARQCLILAREGV